MSPARKPRDASPEKTATTTPLTYFAWRDAAMQELIERHDLRTHIPAKQWRNWFIRNMTPGEAADRAAADHEASRPLIDRKGRWKR
jgi:hypothetical protein